jgi:hypothetical protein
MGAESNGLDPASVARNPGYDPSVGIQASREIPAALRAGGVMAGLGAASGLLTIWAASHADNVFVRDFGYVAGAAEIGGALRAAQGLGMLLLPGSGSGAVIRQGAAIGRYAGGAAAVVLSAYSLYEHLDQHRYDVVLGDSAGIVGGVATLAGAGPVAAVAGAIAACNYGGDWIERKVVESGGSHATGVAVATMSGVAAGAAIGALFFGVGAVPGAIIGGLVGGAAAFVGAYW